MSALVKKRGSPFYYGRFYVNNREFCLSTKIRFKAKGSRDKANQILTQMIEEQSGKVSITGLTKRLLEAISTLPEAQQKIERHRLIARLSVGVGGSLSLGDVWQKWIERFPVGAADKSGEAESRWNRFAAWLEKRHSTQCTVGWISSADAGDYIATLNRQGLARHTVSLHLQTIRRVLDETKTYTSLLANPFAEIKLPKISAPIIQKKPLSDEQIQEVLSLLDPTVLPTVGDKLPSRIRPFRREWFGVAMVGANTGLRLKDCVMLQREQLRDDLTLLSVLPGKMARRGETARVTIPITTKLRNCLLDIVPDSEGFYFPELKQRYEKARSAIAKDFSYLLISMGLTTRTNGSSVRSRNELGFHSIRYHFVTELRRRGADPLVVQRMVGHTSLQMTDHYTEIDRSQKEAALRLLEG